MKFRSVKLWINIITFLALGLLIYLGWDQIVDAFRQLRSLDTGYLLLVPVIQLIGYFAAARFYQSYLKTLDEHQPLWTMFKVSLEMNFVNSVFPSGGASGFGYLGLRMKKLGVPVSKSTLTQVTRHTLTFLSFIVFLLIALLLLAIFGNASRLMILISTTIIFLVIAGFIFVLYIISSPSRIRRFTAFIPKLVNKLIDVFRANKRPTIDIEKIEKLFGDLHEDYVIVRKNWKQLKVPFLWTLVMNFTEIATIYVVYLAFGEYVNPGAIIVAYAVANIAGLIAIIPGGVGVYEGLMTLVMASAGVPKAIALSVTVVYRVLNMLIFLPIGFVFYQLALKSTAPEQADFKS